MPGSCRGTASGSSKTSARRTARISTALRSPDQPLSRWACRSASDARHSNYGHEQPPDEERARTGMSLTLRYAAQSDRGLIRDGNQDSVFAGPRLLAVADGMGGMAAGDVASNIVIGTLAPLDDDVPGSDLIDKLRGSVAAANQRLRDTVDANPQMEGMGTTLTALLFSGSRFGVVHVGDSRAYLLRDGQLAQVTKDD